MGNCFSKKKTHKTDRTEKKRKDKKSSRKTSGGRDGRKSTTTTTTRSRARSCGTSRRSSSPRDASSVRSSKTSTNSPNKSPGGRSKRRSGERVGSKKSGDTKSKQSGGTMSKSTMEKGSKKKSRSASPLKVNDHRSPKLDSSRGNSQASSSPKTSNRDHHGSDGRRSSSRHQSKSPKIDVENQEIVKINMNPPVMKNDAMMGKTSTISSAPNPVIKPEEIEKQPEVVRRCNLQCADGTDASCKVPTTNFSSLPKPSPQPSPVANGAAPETSQGPANEAIRHTTFLPPPPSGKVVTMPSPTDKSADSPQDATTLEARSKPCDIGPTLPASPIGVSNDTQNVPETLPASIAPIPVTSLPVPKDQLPKTQTANQSFMLPPPPPDISPKSTVLPAPKTVATDKSSNEKSSSSSYKSTDSTMPQNEPSDKSKSSSKLVEIEITAKSKSLSQSNSGKVEQSVEHPESMACKVERMLSNSTNTPSSKTNNQTETRNGTEPITGCDSKPQSTSLESKSSANASSELASPRKVDSYMI